MPRHTTLLSIAIIAAHLCASVPDARASCCYQPDPRKEPSTYPQYQSFARAGALIVRVDALYGDAQTPLGYKKLKVSPWTVIDDTYPAAPSRDYHGQPAAGTIQASTNFQGVSGVLVTPDHVLTAGHAVNGSYPNAWAANRRIIFDHANYSLTPPVQMSCDAGGCWVLVSEQNIYECTMVHWEWAGSKDYAVLKLTRAATGRNPIPIERVALPPVGRPVLLAGHPNLIPEKLEVSSVSSIMGENILVAGAHVRPGSSGSMLVDLETGRVTGIVWAGANQPEPDCANPLDHRECFSNPGAAAAKTTLQAAPYIPVWP